MLRVAEEERLDRVARGGIARAERLDFERTRDVLVDGTLRERVVAHRGALVVAVDELGIGERLVRAILVDARHLRLGCAGERLERRSPLLAIAVTALDVRRLL